MATFRSPGELSDWRMIDLSHDEVMKALAQPLHKPSIDKVCHLTCMVITDYDEALNGFSKVISTVEFASIADQLHNTYGPLHDDKYTELNPHSNQLEPISSTSSTTHERKPEMMYEKLELSSPSNQFLEPIPSTSSTKHVKPPEMLHKELDLNHGEVSNTTENLSSEIELLGRFNEHIFSSIDTTQYENFRDFCLMYLGKALEVKPQKLTNLSLSGNSVTSELLIEFLKYLPKSEICSLDLPKVVEKIPSHSSDNSDDVDFSDDDDDDDDDDYYYYDDDDDDDDCGGPRIPWLKHFIATSAAEEEDDDGDNDNDDDDANHSDNNNRGCLNTMYKLCCGCRRRNTTNYTSSEIGHNNETKHDEEVHENWLQYLATILKDTKIKSLNFNNNVINLEMLSCSLVDTEISYLGLRSCEIKDNGLKCLASVLNDTELTSIDLSNTALDCERLKMLVNGLVGTTITSLNLSSNKIGVEGLKYLGGVLKNTAITTIDLSGNMLSHECIEVFAPYLVGSNITSLNLRSNQIGDDGVKCLAHALTNKETNIESIDLGSNDLFDLQTLAICLLNTRITSLSLSGNYRFISNSPNAFEDFCKQLTNITSIDLSKCNLRCNHLKLLSSGLADSNNTSLKSLNLSQNGIEVDGISSLVDILKKHRIAYLDISNNFGEQVGLCSKLLACLNQTNVESLKLEGNMMDFKSLGDGLVGSSLTSIHLGDCTHRFSSYQKCAHSFASLKLNSNITSLTLDCSGCHKDTDFEELVSVLEYTSITSLSLRKFPSQCNRLTNLLLHLPDTKITSLILNGSTICGNIFYLASVLQFTSITSLDLSDCAIFEGNHISEVQNKIDSNNDSLILRNRDLCFFSVCYLARQLCRTKFNKLNLSGNKMAYNALKYLSQGLLGSQIVELDLSSTRVDCCGVYYLAQVLRHTWISSLNLSHNEIACKGIKYLADALVGCQMKSLDLSQNRIKDEGIQHLAQHFSNTGISEINLRRNGIEIQTAYQFFNSVKQRNMNQMRKNVTKVHFSRYMLGYMGLYKYSDCIVEICKPFNRDDVNCLIKDTYGKLGITKLLLKGENFAHYLGTLDNISITEYEHRFSRRPRFVLDDDCPIVDIPPILLNSNIAVLSLNYLNYRISLMAQNESILKVKVISLKLVRTVEDHYKKHFYRSPENNCNIDIRYFKALISSNIFYLDLSNTYTTCYDIEVLAEFLKDTNIISLNLSNNSLEARSVEFLANVLPLTRIIYIDLNGNTINYSGYEYFLKAAPKSSVCWLSLANNNIEGGLQENIELSPFIVPRADTPIEFQIRYLFIELVSLNSTGEQFEFIVPRDESVMTISHYPHLLKHLPHYKIHIYDYFYMLTMRHDIHMLNKVNSFVEDMKHKFNTFIESKMMQLGERFGYDCFVILVRECDRLDLSEFVDLLLLHRSLYYVDDEQNFLHPYIYKMLHEYKLPLYNADIEPNKRQQIIFYFEQHSGFDCAREIINLLSELQV
ncbi:uncharacterized protein LOC120350782 isoform X2 [Nilaparvata lugens]|uniref:uncharacterized protein LOC120350782 isoform X2 n=1 Tax=Nilaparvata lugens TaxID=108931 RepID=UPI00193EB089|nr:uncharacterized protein LOC120350782 isoform X2 [Nilaparvata lugens]